MFPRVVVLAEDVVVVACFTAQVVKTVVVEAGADQRVNFPEALELRHPSAGAGGATVAIVGGGGVGGDVEEGRRGRGKRRRRGGRIGGTRRRNGDCGLAGGGGGSGVFPMDIRGVG